MAPFNLGRSVSTHSPYHGRLREGRAGIKIEVVCKEVGSGAGCVYVLDGPDAKPVWRCSGAERWSGAAERPERKPRPPSPLGPQTRGPLYPSPLFSFLRPTVVVAHTQWRCAMAST